MKPFFLEHHINIVNGVTLQSFWFIFTMRYDMKYQDMTLHVYTDYYIRRLWAS